MRLRRDRRGQMRIAEAILAAILIFSAFIIASSLSTPYRVWLSKERSELEGQGFSILNMMATNGILEEVLQSRPYAWEQRIRVLLLALLPSDVNFDLTVYSVDLNANPSDTAFVKVNTSPITNYGSENLIDEALAVVTDKYPYTSESNTYYMLILSLSRGGPS